MRPLCPECPATHAATSMGVPLHIVQRGHNREPCFFAEEDYRSYLRWLGEALGEAGCALHAPHPVYRALGRDDKDRQVTYRALGRTQLERAAIDDIRLALNQSQPLGNERFYAKI